MRTIDNRLFRDLLLEGSIDSAYTFAALQVSERRPIIDSTGLKEVSLLTDASHAEGTQVQLSELKLSLLKVRLHTQSSLQRQFTRKSIAWMTIDMTLTMMHCFLITGILAHLNLGIFIQGLPEDKFAQERAAQRAQELQETDENGKPLTKKARVARQKAADRQVEELAAAAEDRLTPEVSHHFLAHTSTTGEYCSTIYYLCCGLGLRPCMPSVVYFWLLNWWAIGLDLRLWWECGEGMAVICQSHWQLVARYQRCGTGSLLCLLTKFSGIALVWFLPGGVFTSLRTTAVIADSLASLIWGWNTTANGRHCGSCWTDLDSSSIYSVLYIQIQH